MDHHTAAGSKEALHHTIEAIRTLKRLEATGSSPNPDETAILSRYGGFGALARTAFPDPVTGTYAKGWEALGQELRAALTDEEYASARASTFTAFYTPEPIRNAIWQALTRMGIGTGCRGLEPGCGVGGFLAAAPPDVELLGIEQDRISGRIATLLYPDHTVRIESFKDTPLSEGAVDFVIGNVPFAEIKLPYQGERFALHDYFFMKSIDALRPGGVLALVTSRYTLDKKHNRVRQQIAEQAEFLGAIRLPTGAFRTHGTDVVTDIVFLQKRTLLRSGADSVIGRAHSARTSDQVGAQPARRMSAIQSWLSTRPIELDGGEVIVNDYFQEHPEMVLGDMGVGTGLYHGQELRVAMPDAFEEALGRAITHLPRQIVPPRTTPLPALPSPASQNITEPEGGFLVGPDQAILQIIRGRAVPVELRGKPLMANGTPGGRRLGGLIALKHAAREVLASQREGAPEETREAARQTLRQAYARFLGQFGPINKATLSERADGSVVRRLPNLLRFMSDPDVYLVMALEEYDERTGKAGPTAIMHRDVVTGTPEVTQVESARDGLVASLNQRGAVDIAYIASLYGRSQQQVIDELRGIAGEALIFFDPEQDTYVTADAYLSGNVRHKLRAAQASVDPRTRGNVEALTAVQPEDLVAEEIDVTLGTPWIPAADVQHFVADLLEIPLTRIQVAYVQQEALWKVRTDMMYRGSALATSTYGTLDMDACTLVEQALNMRTPTVRRKISGGPGEGDAYVVDQEATLAAREKQSELKERFGQWVFTDPDRKERLVAFYNRNFNNLRLRTFDGAHLAFPRMSQAITLRPHQKDAVWRTVASGNTLLAHVVGAGKTFTMIASGMEMKRMGVASKPLYVVPNHMLEQFAREALVLYPDARLLVATKHDLSKGRRQHFKARIATGNWDGVVMTHSSFGKIAMSPEFEADFLAGQVEAYEELLVSVTDQSITRNLTKRIEKMKAARKIKLGEMMEAENKDTGLTFEMLGVDQLFIDEAHMFKNLETPTKMDRVAGIQTGGSQRAFDLFMKARYLHKRTPGRGLVFATGTPISNSLGEMYTMMRYLMPEKLQERGIGHFDGWAAAFGEVVGALEISPDGQSLRVNSRFARFRNLPELLTLFRQAADVQTGSMLDLPTPKLTDGKAEVIASPMSFEQSEIQDTLVSRYERVRSAGIDPRVDNALRIVTDGRKLALDIRLLHPDAEDVPDAKINRVIDKVHAIWERTQAARATQMIFCDLGVRPTPWGFSVYEAIITGLEARGIPSREIASIGDATTDPKKEALFASVRAGQVRVLLGSTAKMGTGTNVQTRLCALHHVDPPWRPADIEQREGRILRQGNQNAEVAIYRYVTEGSFDAYMWQTLETKAKFISQAMEGDAGTRRADDIGAAELSFAEVKAIASGNPAMLVLAEMDLDVRRLTLLRKAFLREQARSAEQCRRLPEAITWRQVRIAGLTADSEQRQDTKGEAFVMTMGDATFRPEKHETQTARQRAQEGLARAIAQAAATSSAGVRRLGHIGGLDIVLTVERGPITGALHYDVSLKGTLDHHVTRIANPTDCPPLIQKLEHCLNGLDGQKARLEGERTRMETDLARHRKQAEGAFPSEELYRTLVPLRDRLKALLRAPEDSEAYIPDEITAIIARYRVLETGNNDRVEPPTPQVPDTTQPVQAPAPREVQAPEEVVVPVTEGPPIPRRQKPATTGGVQLGLFEQEVRPTPTTRVVKAISHAPVQLGLFEREPTVIEARAHSPAAWEIQKKDETDHPSLASSTEDEATAWRMALSDGEVSDMRDMLEHGHLAGAPKPSEKAVLGRFTRLVGDRPRLADIVHDAITHYQPYGSMVDRIERELGRKRPPSPTEERANRSLYNATLHKESLGRDGW